MEKGKVVKIINPHNAMFNANYYPATCAGCSLAADGGRGRARGLHELRHDVDGDREDDGGVVLRGDAVQGLEIPQLKKN